jgi:hypothetical protein
MFDPPVRRGNFCSTASLWSDLDFKSARLLMAFDRLTIPVGRLSELLTNTEELKIIRSTNAAAKQRTDGFLYGFRVRFHGFVDGLQLISGNALLSAGLGVTPPKQTGVPCRYKDCGAILRATRPHP